METLTHTTQSEQLALPEWETPIITQLEIKMTLNGSGVFTDGIGGSEFPPVPVP